MKHTVLRPAVGAAALVLLLTGCSEAASGSSAGSPAEETVGAIDAAVGTDFSGGTPGEASASETPVTIGLITQEGGAISNPEFAAAAQAAFDYVNAEQSGIGGHPIELEVCKVTSSEESAQQCAQQFLNDADVDVVFQGGLNVGSQAVHQTIAGAKPVVIGLANPGPDMFAQNAYAVDPSVIAALPGVATYGGAQGYQSMGIVVSSDPGNLAIAEQSQQIFTGAGIESQVSTFPPGTTDLTSAFTAALGSQPDALAPITVTTSGCIASAEALGSIGSDTPVVASALCATEDLREGLGDFPEWAYESTNLLLFAPDETGQVDFYRAVMAEYAGEDAQLGVTAPEAFGAAFLIADVLNGVGADAITPESAAIALKGYSDGVLLGTPKVAFGSVPQFPTLSGMADRFYVYEGGEWTATDWQNVPQ